MGYIRLCFFTFTLSGNATHLRGTTRIQVHGQPVRALVREVSGSGPPSIPADCLLDVKAKRVEGRERICHGVNGALVHQRASGKG